MSIRTILFDIEDLNVKLENVATIQSSTLSNYFECSPEALQDSIELQANMIFQYRYYSAIFYTVEDLLHDLSQKYFKLTDALLDAENKHRKALEKIVDTCKAAESGGEGA